MNALRTAAAVAAVAWIASVAPAQTLKTVKVAFDEKADFTKYKTYAWAETQEPVDNPANHIRITQAVERELEAKGMTKAAEGAAADVRVRYFAKIEKKLKSTSRQETNAWEPTNLRTMVDLSRVKTGTLILELTDGETKDLVWRGVNTDVAPRADLVAAALDSYVTKILAAYPPKPKTP